MYVQFKGYNVNVDHAKELKSLSELKKDNRFFHQHFGDERNQLCEEFYSIHISPEEQAPQKTVIDLKKADNGARQPEKSDTES